MRIIRLELYGFKRLVLNNIVRFVYTPTSPYQLILGTNGSGKSSVLMELSPLPGHSSNYARDGLKDITVEHGGMVYRLVSNFKTGKHSFLTEDGENLNPGGTGEVQYRLVEQYFNYTKDLHSVVSGEALFTSMSPAERRKWITSLPNIDYQYPLAVYKRIAAAARDQVGASKHLKGRLTQEHANLKALGSIDGLEGRGHQLREELNALLVSRAPHSGNVAELERRLDEIVGQVADMGRRIVTGVHQLRNQYPVRNFQELEVLAQRNDHDLAGQRVLVTRLNTEYSELETAIHGFQTSDGITPENIEVHLLELREKISLASDYQSTFVFGDDVEDVARDSELVIPQLVSLFTRLPDNTDRRYSKGRIDLARTERQQFLETISKLRGRIEQATQRITMIQQSQSMTCPSCSYLWTPGVSEGELDALERSRTVWSTEWSGLEIRCKILDTFLEEASEAATLYSEFRGLNANYPRLRQLWDHIAEHYLHLNAPSGHQGVFLQWLQDVRRGSQIHQLVHRYNQLQELSEQWTQAGGVSHLGQRMAKIVTSIEAETQKLNQMRNVVSEQSAYVGRVRNLDNLVGQMGALVSQIDQQYVALVEGYRSREIDAVTHHHQNELAGIQRQLTEHRTLQGIVRDLEQGHEQVDLASQDLALLAKALSPVEGLIAEQISGFIECLVGQLNSVLQTIWTYDMVIQPCGMESGELNYKFPVHVRGEMHSSPDIDKTSKGMKQVINLAFQLTVMLYKGLTDYPLYLDEPAEGFDESHRINLMSFFKQLMDNNYHSQMFMVSHHAASHGAFSTAEVLVLDGSNIAVPGEYNKHVILS